MKDLRDYSLLSHNTFGIDVKCRRYLEYASMEEAVEVTRILQADRQPLLILGGGSNLLLTKDFPGVVVTPENRKEIGVSVREESPETVYLSCWAGTTFDDVVDDAVRHGYHGMENLSLIPGEVGASAVQNIGAYGAEAKDIIDRVDAVEIATGRKVSFANVDGGYSYRQSKFKHEWKDKYLVTGVTYKLSKIFTPKLEYGNIRAKLSEMGIGQPTAAELRSVIIDIRNAKLPDPKVQGNAGSFFMNPIVSTEKYRQLAAQYPAMPHYTIDSEHEKIPAGWMIDQCGWKGKSLGRAGVHDKQALVLVNRGGATGEEVVALMHAIQHDVCQRFGIEIHPEVNVH